MHVRLNGSFISFTAGKVEFRSRDPSFFVLELRPQRTGVFSWASKGAVKVGSYRDAAFDDEVFHVRVTGGGNVAMLDVVKEHEVAPLK